MQDNLHNSDGDIRLGEDNKFLRWLDNYWYHYKWRTIIVAFFVFLFIFVFAQCQTDPVKDVVVAYCGPTGYMKTEMEIVQNSLKDVMPADFDGNGQKYVEFVRYIHYSDEEIAQKKAESNDEWTINIAYNNSQLKDFRSFIQMSIMTEECSVFLMSPYVYGKIEENPPFVMLSEIWESGKPANAKDNYSICISDTKWYQENEELQKTVPADTLLCLVTATDRDSEKFHRSLEMFRAMAKMP